MRTRRCQLEHVFLILGNPQVKPLLSLVLRFLRWPSSTLHRSLLYIQKISESRAENLDKCLFCVYNKYIMRKLDRSKRKAILAELVEGYSINLTTRMCGVSKLTLLRLLAEVGSLCRDYHDIAVRGLNSKRVQCDELWSFVGCKQKHRERGKAGHGDAWTWVGMDADSKLVLAYLVSNRGGWQPVSSG